jgi:hypothetical protein
MKYAHICPRCRRASWRYCSGDTVPTCRHEYHDAKDCGTCGDCRNGGIVDASGRWLAPAQDLPVRAPGPWDGNGAKS